MKTKFFLVFVMSLFIIATNLACSSIDSYKSSQESYLSFHEKTIFQNLELHFAKIITEQDYNIIIVHMVNASKEVTRFSLDEYRISDSSNNSIPIWGFYCYERSLSTPKANLTINSIFFPEFCYQMAEFKGVILDPDTFDIMTLTKYGSTSQGNSESNLKELAQKNLHTIEEKKDKLVKYLTDKKSVYVHLPLHSKQESKRVNQFIELPKKTNLFLILYTLKPLTKDGNILIKLGEKQYQLRTDDKDNFIDMANFVPVS